MRWNGVEPGTSMGGKRVSILTFLCGFALWLFFWHGDGRLRFGMHFL